PPSSTLFPYTTLFRSVHAPVPFNLPAAQLADGQPAYANAAGFARISEDRFPLISARFPSGQPRIPSNPLIVRAQANAPVTLSGYSDMFPCVPHTADWPYFDVVLSGLLCCQASPAGFS